MIPGPNDKKKMTEMQLQPQRNPSGTEIADSFIYLFIDKKILIAIKKSQTFTTRPESYKV